jgi:hypothetical protein
MDHESHEVKFTTRGALLGLIAYIGIVLIVTVVFA